MRTIKTMQDVQLLEEVEAFLDAFIANLWEENRERRESFSFNGAEKNFILDIWGAWSCWTREKAQKTDILHDQRTDEAIEKPKRGRHLSSYNCLGNVVIADDLKSDEIKK